MQHAAKVVRTGMFIHRVYKVSSVREKPHQLVQLNRNFRSYNLVVHQIHRAIEVLVFRKKQTQSPDILVISDVSGS